MYRPVPLADRAAAAPAIVLGSVIGEHAYWDAQKHNIYTLTRIRVDAWLKGHNSATEVGIISMGGFIGDRGQITYPTVRLPNYNEYILFLEGDNTTIHDPELRSQRPDLIQTQLYADQQGALTKQFGIYHDHMRLFEPCTETEVFAKIQALTGLTPTTPSGEPFAPRPYEPPTGDQRQLPITSFTPNPSNGGTIVPADFITITGSGFGAAAGTVFYTNADDGGATLTSTGVATDNTAWSDGSITNKIAPNAGLGPISINGAMTSASNLSINYGHSAVISNFSGFASNTRQRYYHRNMNAAGGISFRYNTTSGMSANAAAVASFERALQTWRCLTFINWFCAGTSTNGLADDNVNIVMFDNTMPAGVLGQATSRFSGSASGGCSLANTVWCVEEIDIRFDTDPPSAGIPWEYGPAAPAFSEFDFESVAVHELGHAHGLQHRISAGQVMHFAIANGQQARTPAGGDVTGAAVRMAYSSVATCLNPAACGSGPMTLLNAGNCALPVTYLSFDGIYTPGQGNVLSWTTAEETAMLGYFLERSLDGQRFDAITFVPAVNNPAIHSQYNHTDAEPFLPRKTWYRLRQRDIEGHEDYTQVIEVIRPDLADAQVVFLQGTEQVLFRGFADGPVALYDTQGRILAQGQVKERQGTISTQGLSAGMYMWRTTGSGTASGKVMVAR